MKFSIHKEESHNFLSIFVLGIVSAVQSGSISTEEAWNWGLNLRMLEYVIAHYGEGGLESIVHLGTELESVKRIIPEHFDTSCDEIINLCHKLLRVNGKDADENDLHLTIE